MYSRFPIQYTPGIDECSAESPSLAVSNAESDGDFDVAGEVAVVSGPDSPGLPVTVFGNSWTCSGPAEADKPLRPLGAEVARSENVGGVAAVAAPGLGEPGEPGDTSPPREVVAVSGPESVRSAWTVFRAGSSCPTARVRADWATSASGKTGFAARPLSVGSESP